MSNSTGEPQSIYPTAAARAEVAWLEGDPEGVCDATNDALALACADSWFAGELACWRWRQHRHPGRRTRSHLSSYVGSSWSAYA